MPVTMVRLLLLAALLLVHGETYAETPAEKAGFPPRMIIYAAKGPANSCGPGCDRWIAVEGEVDVGAAARVGRFLREARDQRPIYFHSPGGSVRQSYVIGRLLRGRKAVARVGRTIATACAGGTQIDAACLKIKTAGDEVAAELTTRNAMCNSACGYLFLGAATREVAPDAAIAVHSSKLKVATQGPISPQQIAEYKERTMATADRERAAFVTSMGISRELDDLIKTVKYESLHVLTRSQLHRFGIDTRSQSETSWTFETAARPYVRKIAVAKAGDGASFRTVEWRLFCENKDRARLMFVRESEGGSGPVSTTMMLQAGADKAVKFGKFPARVGKFDVWSEAVAPDTMQAMLTASSLQMGEGAVTSEGKSHVSTFEVGTLGLEPSWTKLLASCTATAPRPPAVPFTQVLPPGISSAPGILPMPAKPAP